MAKNRQLNVEPASSVTSGQRPWLLALLVKNRFPILFVLHIFVFAAVLWCAFLMRFTLNVPATYAEQYVSLVGVICLIKVLIFYLMRSFHGWWRHVNFSDFISLAKSASVASAGIIAVDYFVFPGQIPRTIVLNDFVMTIIVIGGLRSVWRVWDERIVPLDRSRISQRALLLGNDVESARVAHLINRQHQLGTRVVGLVSHGVYPRGQQFSDLRIVGRLNALPRLMSEHRTRTLFVVAGTMRGRDLRGLLDTAGNEGFNIKILPKLEEQLRGLDHLPVREVAYDDLLRRKPASLDLGSINRVVEGKTVLVTGAGGSIGSELCRQLMRFSPKKLILLGRGENRIYQIEREFRENALGIEVIPRIVNITDQKRMEEVFRTCQPDLVFHAAAHKHVPLVEQNVGESIVNNVLGTKVVADLADQFGVERFVLVSTDKAVHPTSVMGCTKQMAERYCQSLGEESSTRFISTRFGNVLGSAGSVVPLFQDQIRKGGPITITDKRMTRYFMTIPEASQLVVQAMAMGEGGEIFVLEMGEPVKILDLAKDLIRLAGHAADSIEIVENGIRPGEKLFEELYYESEESLPTEHEQILASVCRVFPKAEIDRQVGALIDIAYTDPTNVRAKLKEFIPEFKVNPDMVPTPKRVDQLASSTTSS